MTAPNPTAPTRARREAERLYSAVEAALEDTWALGRKVRKASRTRDAVNEACRALHAALVRLDDVSWWVDADLMKKHRAESRAGA